MDRQQTDELYHLMRVASNDCTSDELSKLYGLIRHLFCGGDYLSLIQYSAWYGERYILPELNELLDNNFKLNTPVRIVELGAGLGWLSRGLCLHYHIDKMITVDKRPWGATTERLNIENKEDRDYLISKYPADGRTLIVASEFLHCCDNQKEIIDAFYDYDMLILEYVGWNEESFKSYQDQLGRYGAMVPTLPDLRYILGDRAVFSKDRSILPYLVAFIGRMP